MSQFDMEVCVTPGEIGPVEARKLKAAGVTAYNHNIDTSPEFYPGIVSTHTFSGSFENDRCRASERYVGLLRRNYRDGRVRE